MVTFGISTWSIHRSLTSGEIALLNVPAKLREQGLSELHVCHFHMPADLLSWSGEFRRRLDDHGVTLNTMLLDFGNLAHPEQGPKDVAEHQRWLETSAALGATNARIPAGQEKPTPDALQRSADHLLQLADAGDRLGVRVITENWQETLPGSEEVLQLLKLTNDRIPLCVDTGTWPAPQKYEDLKHIAHAAVTVHAKADYSPTAVLDEVDFRRTLGILKRADFAGPIALIYSGPSSDEWRHIDDLFKIAQDVFAK